MTKATVLLALLALATGITNQATAQKPTKEVLKEFERPKSIPYPSENPYSDEKELLGRTLFFDPRISGSKWISCNTCHNAGIGWEDALPKGLGHGMKTLGRHTPTVLNLAWGELFFWDGRAASLEEQALGPIESGAEMNMSLNDMISSLRSIKGYEPMFKKAFPADKDPVNKENVGRAIATFERTVVSGDAPFDRWLKGDSKAMTDRQVKGFDLFRTKANCTACHSGWRFTDDSFHDIGIKGKDIGRGKFVKSVKMKHAFKTPTLRNIVERAPYLHDGSGKTLLDVVKLYNRGGDVKRPSLSSEIKPLNMTDEECEAVVDFLTALSSKDKDVIYPQLPN